MIVRGSEPLGLDQGLFACFGRWLRAGWLPYRDLFDSKPPLHLYTWVLAWAGGSTAGAWLFEACWLAATAGLGFALARRWWGRWAGLAAAACVVGALWAPAFGGYWSRLQAEELLALPALAAAWSAETARSRPRAAFACGVWTGIAALYKVPALAVGGAWCVLWLASLPPREAGRRIAWWAAGVAAPWLVASAWFAAHGAFGLFANSVLVYQQHWMKMITPPWGGVVREFVATAGGALAPLLLAAAAGLALEWRRDRARAIALAAWLGLAALAIVLQRQLAGYHYLLLAPGLALAAARGIAGLAALAAARPLQPRRTVPALAALLAIAALALASGRTWLAAYGGGGDDPRGQFAPAEEQAVARYVAAHSAPEAGLLVWALAPGIYALADRHPVTRFPFHRLLLTDAPLAHEVPGRDDRRAELLARLAADPPAYIVLGNHDANPFEPDSITSLFGFPALAALVQRDFHEELRTAHFVVLGRTPPAR